MKPAKDANGYLRTVMDGKTIKVHRVVAETFVMNPENKSCVDHIDNNRANNKAENLQWVTQHENALLAKERGRLVGVNEGEKSPSAKMTEKQAYQVFELMEKYTQTYGKAVRIAKEVGLTLNQVHDISRGKTWRFARQRWESMKKSMTSQ